MIRLPRGHASRLPRSLLLLFFVAMVALTSLDLVFAPRVVAATNASIGVAVARVTPAVATPGRPVTVQVNVTNGGSAPVTEVVVRAAVGAGTLPTRRAVQEFGAGRGSLSTRPVAETTIAGPIPAGRSVPATLTIDAADVPSVGAYGVHPLVIEAVGASVTVRQRTYLPVHTRKEYEPMQLAFALPLTLDADPAQVTATGAELDDAWTRLAGPGSRIDRTLAATEGRAVTLAIEPALVGYTDEGVAHEAPSSGSTPPPDGSEVIDDITTSVAERLTRNPATRIWELPPGDPDLSALTAPGVDPRLLASVAELPTDLSSRLNREAAQIPRVAWPVGEPLDDARRLAVSTAFSGRPQGEQAAFITDSASVDGDPAVSGVAARRTPGGSPLLVSDDGLSAALAGATRAADAGGDTQRFLSESLVLLAESPGRPRTTLVTAPRSFSPDPEALRALLDAAGTAPWIEVVPTDTLITAASSPDAPTARPGSPNSSPPAATVKRSPLTPGVVDELISTGQHIAGVSSVLAATDTSGRIPRASTIHALASTRWRGREAAFGSTLTAVTQRVETLTTGVTVLPSTVNFLAEHGVIQVTVINNLDVAVQNVRLVLEPQGRPPRLRVTAPEPLSIAPGSRTTVRVSVDAVAAGVVPVSTYLTTATGTRLGADATVNVRVQPTGGWVVTVGGVLVGLTFVVGLYRTFRRGRPRVTEADLEGIDLE